MPTVRYTAESGRYRVAGTNFEPGDTAEVAAGLADHLVEDVGTFEYVDGDADSTSDGAESEGGDGSDDDESDDEGGLAETLRDMTVSEFEEELESGRFDDRLDAVADAERDGKDRTGVHDAIGIRRAEIEG